MSNLPRALNMHRKVGRPAKLNPVGVPVQTTCMNTAVSGFWERTEWVEKHIQKMIKVCREYGDTNDLLGAIERNGVTYDQFSRAKYKHPRIQKEYKLAQDKLTDLVEQSLHKLATGKATTETTDYDAEGVVRSRKVTQVPPDKKAAQIWLNNRRADEWKEKVEVDTNAQLGYQPFVVNIQPVKIEEKREIVETKGTVIDL